MLMTTLLKVGGSILNDGLSEEIVNDLKNLSNKENFVIVHGGGKEVTSIAEKLGKKRGRKMKVNILSVKPYAFEGEEGEAS